MAAVTATTIAATGTFDAALKDFYVGMIRRILNRQARLYSYLKKGSKPVTGRKVVFPVNPKGSSAVRFMPAGRSLPAAVPQTEVASEIKMAQVWGTIQVNYDVIAQANGKGAFEEPVAFEVSRMTDDAIEQMNRSAFGDGVGRLAEVDSLSGQDITLKDLDDAAGTGINANSGNRYIRIGDVIEVGQADTTTRRAGPLTVTAKNVTTNTITVTGTTTGIAAGDQVYVANPANDGTLLRSLEPMGIGGIIDDGTLVSSLQGISRTTYPIWKAQAFSANSGSFASPGALTLDDLQTGIDMASAGGPGFPAVALMEYATRREFLKLVETSRRYTTPYEYKPGIKENHLKEWPWESTLEYGGFPFAFDKHCPWRTIFYIDPRGVKKWVWKEWEWVSRGKDGGATMYLLQGVAGTYEGQGAALYNLGTDQVGPGTCTVIRNIAVTKTNGSPKGRVDNE